MTLSRCLSAVAVLFSTLVFSSTNDIARAAGHFPSTGEFSITYTFATSTPASPIDVGKGRDLVVNHYLATTVNDAGGGFLHLAAGHCTNIRFVFRGQRMLDSRGYCHFRDGDGDDLFAEYTTGTPKPTEAIALQWTFVDGSGKYDGITGTAHATNSNNLDASGSYQAAGKIEGSYRILRSSIASDNNTHD